MASARFDIVPTKGSYMIDPGGLVSPLEPGDEVIITGFRGSVRELWVPMSRDELLHLIDMKDSRLTEPEETGDITVLRPVDGEISLRIAPGEQGEWVIECAIPVRTDHFGQNGKITRYGFAVGWSAPRIPVRRR